MFTQFRAHYPQGSLITELSAIEYGQYIVRCLVQVEGQTLVTGLAAAQTVELAEEQARSRALAVLGIDTTTTVIAEKETPLVPPKVVVPPKPKANLPQELPSPNLEQIQLTQFPPDSSVNDSSQVSSDDASVEELNYHASKTPPVEQKNTPPYEFSSLTEPQTSQEESTPQEGEGKKESTEAETPGQGDAETWERGDGSNGNPTPNFVHPPLRRSEEIPPSQLNDLPVKSSFFQSEIETDHSNLPPTSSPLDMSDIIARSTVEVKRLGWTNQQGKDYLLQTYGKRSRQLLTDDELLDFLSYLESQPTPEDV
ncbi:MAG: hypothetical protein F6J86_06965 [Symploca sp. SIO1B1]|nr:hypothetical protein [Symploca sp. SIO1B1]